MKRYKQILLFIILMNISALAQDGEWEIIDKGAGMPPYVAPYYTIDCYDDMNCILFGNYNINFQSIE
jgi:hypothetical protein